MLTLEKLRDYMRIQAEEDRKKKSVQIKAASLEEALKQASIELSVPVKKLEYEILEKGGKGMLGFGKKDCILIAYQQAEEESADTFFENAQALSEGEGEDASLNRDGQAVVRLTPDGIILKILPPTGKGKRISEKSVHDLIRQKGISNYNHDLVSRAVRSSDAQPVRIGEFIYNPINDAIMTVDVTDFDLKAYLTIKPPGHGGTEPDAERIISFLKNNNIIHGFIEETINQLEDFPVYNSPVLVAEGTLPQNGADAKIIYNFSNNRTEIRLKERNGRVDFKEMNLIQNVVEGQALAKKIPPEMGKTGRTVRGKIVPAKDGSDVSINIGKNVKLSDDGFTAIAAINGQVVLTNEKINVEPILVVPGNVNLKTGGNILFLGTVLVKGSVDDGFKVKASGNIEVLGNVNKSELDAEGDIIVHQGINGKSGGQIRSGKGVWSKFIENATVESGDVVVVSDGIINSNVDTNKKIICQGKRAAIVGGRLRAAEEINAKTLGSVAGSETILEVGYDPKSKAKLVELEKKIAELTKEREDIELNIHTLENLLKVKKTLPEEKAVFYAEQKERKIKIIDEVEKLNGEIEEIKNYLASLKIVGRISSSGRVFPGVRIFIKDAVLDVRNEFRAVTFINDGGVVKITKYEEPDEDYNLKR